MTILEDYKKNNNINFENTAKNPVETQGKHQKNNRTDKRDTLKDIIPPFLHNNNDFLKLLDDKWFQKTGKVS